MTEQEFYRKENKTQWEWENLVVRTTKKPFICGGYTQMDWDTLNGAFIDLEFLCDYCDPLDAFYYETNKTKPIWAKY